MTQAAWLGYDYIWIMQYAEPSFERQASKKLFGHIMHSRENVSDSTRLNAANFDLSKCRIQTMDEWLS